VPDKRLFSEGRRFVKILSKYIYTYRVRIRLSSVLFPRLYIVRIVYNILANQLNIKPQRLTISVDY